MKKYMIALLLLPPTFMWDMQVTSNRLSFEIQGEEGFRKVEIKIDNNDNQFRNPADAPTVSPYMTPEEYRLHHNKQKPVFIRALKKVGKLGLKVGALLLKVIP